MVEVKTEIKEQAEKKGFAAAFDAVEDAETLRLLGIAKSLGGASSKDIVALGVKAYLQTPEFKKKAELIRNMKF